MGSNPTEQSLKRKLESLRSRDMSTMGYEAKARHELRIKLARQAYARVTSGRRVSQPEASGEPVPACTTEQRTGLE